MIGACAHLTDAVIVAAVALLGHLMSPTLAFSASTYTERARRMAHGFLMQLPCAQHCQAGQWHGIMIV